MDTHKHSKKGVAFYIDEEDSDKDETHELISAPAIVVDPPSDASGSEVRLRKGSL